MLELRLFVAGEGGEGEGTAAEGAEGPDGESEGDSDAESTSSGGGGGGASDAALEEPAPLAPLPPESTTPPPTDASTPMHIAASPGCSPPPHPLLAADNTRPASLPSRDAEADPDTEEGPR